MDGFVGASDALDQLVVPGDREAYDGGRLLHVEDHGDVVQAHLPEHPVDLRHAGKTSQR